MISWTYITTISSVGTESSATGYTVSSSSNSGSDVLNNSLGSVSSASGEGYTYFDASSSQSRNSSSVNEDSSMSYYATQAGVVAYNSAEIVPDGYTSYGSTSGGSTTLIGDTASSVTQFGISYGFLNGTLTTSSSSVTSSHSYGTQGYQTTSTSSQTIPIQITTESSFPLTYSGLSFSSSYRNVTTTSAVGTSTYYVLTAFTGMKSSGAFGVVSAYLPAPGEVFCFPAGDASYDYGSNLITSSDLLTTSVGIDFVTFNASNDSYYLTEEGVSSVNTVETVFTYTTASSTTYKSNGAGGFFSGPCTISRETTSEISTYLGSTLTGYNEYGRPEYSTSEMPLTVSTTFLTGTDASGSVGTFGYYVAGYISATEAQITSYLALSVYNGYLQASYSSLPLMGYEEFVPTVTPTTTVFQGDTSTSSATTTTFTGVTSFTAGGTGTDPVYTLQSAVAAYAAGGSSSSGSSYTGVYASSEGTGFSLVMNNPAAFIKTPNFGFRVSPDAALVSQIGIGDSSFNLAANEGSYVFAPDGQTVPVQYPVVKSWADSHSVSYSASWDSLTLTVTGKTSSTRASGGSTLTNYSTASSVLNWTGAGDITETLFIGRGGSIVPLGIGSYGTDLTGPATVILAPGAYAFSAYSTLVTALTTLEVGTGDVVRGAPMVSGFPIVGTPGMPFVIDTPAAYNQ